MPERSRRAFATHSARITKIVDAPLRYVYTWCTDFREDDGRLSKSRPRFQVLPVTRDRIVRIRTTRTRGKRPAVAVEMVRLKPPNAWHVDQIDEIDLDAVDYRLTRLSARRTKLDMWFTERWMNPTYPTRTEWSQSTSRYWDNVIATLECDYRAGRPAKG